MGNIIVVIIGLLFVTWFILYYLFAGGPDYRITTPEQAYDALEKELRKLGVKK